MSRKHLVSLGILILLAVMTFVTLFKEDDISAVIIAIKTFDNLWLIAAFIAALLFVALEGSIICMLIRTLKRRVSLLQCIKWSFIGFFFSGITPSATGGQPVQLYYMSKKGLKVSESTPVLMLTAVLYKFVQVCIGISLWLFWRKPLSGYMGKYIWLFYLGVLLNAIVVVLLIFIMIKPSISTKIILGGEHLLTTLRFLKKSSERTERLVKAIDEYHEVVRCFKYHQIKILIALCITFIQRCCSFLLIWIIYRGMGLSGYGVIPIMAMQASITVAVDLLPLPGSSGITELVYSTVFARLFTGELLTASLCLSRGIGFYLVLIISALIWGVAYLKNKREMFQMS